MYLLQVKKLNKKIATTTGPGRAKHKPVLKDISFTIDHGEVIGLAGESGCGKSTLARCLCGMYDFDAGEVYLNGIDIKEVSKKNRSTNLHKIQMIFQNPDLAMNPLHRVRRILTEPQLQNPKVKKDEALRRAEQMLIKVGLNNEMLARRPHQLSGGQKQRVAIARTLLLKPQLIIADEPVSSLDADLREEIMNLLIKESSAENCSILLISHDVRELLKHTGRIMIMKNGTIIETVENMVARSVYTKKLFEVSGVFSEEGELNSGRAVASA